MWPRIGLQSFCVRQLEHLLFFLLPISLGLLAQLTDLAPSETSSLSQRPSTKQLRTAPHCHQVMLLKASCSGARAATRSSPAQRLVCGCAAVVPGPTYTTRSAAAAGARRHTLSVPDPKQPAAEGSALTPPAFGAISRGMADAAAPPKASAAPAVAEAEVSTADNPLLAVSGAWV